VLGERDDEAESTIRDASEGDKTERADASEGDKTERADASEGDKAD
jgi:hypothetical protein